MIPGSTSIKEKRSTKCLCKEMDRVPQSETTKGSTASLRDEVRCGSAATDDSPRRKEKEACEQRHVTTATYRDCPASFTTTRCIVQQRHERGARGIRKAEPRLFYGVSNTHFDANSSLRMLWFVSQNTDPDLMHRCRLKDFAEGYRKAEDGALERWIRLPTPLRSRWGPMAPKGFADANTSWKRKVSLQCHLGTQNQRHSRGEAKRAQLMTDWCLFYVARS